MRVWTECERAGCDLPAAVWIADPDARLDGAAVCTGHVGDQVDDVVDELLVVRCGD